MALPRAPPVIAPSGLTPCVTVESDELTRPSMPRHRREDEGAGGHVDEHDGQPDDDLLGHQHRECNAARATRGRERHHRDRRGLAAVSEALMTVLAPYFLTARPLAEAPEGAREIHVAVRLAPRVD